ncbi:plastocyanin/azurin family copper-binding protein [Natronorubrum sp. FCH18a]|uniref:plastocyanin/azurin family copper-binding protein n=1 Tax=Natronorubrum sp. FCH18a TaxID=3447018 RepID=UPI003F516867
MTTADRLTRRTLLYAAGVATSAGVLAGCVDEAGTDGEPEASADDADDDDESGDTADGDEDPGTEPDADESEDDSDDDGDVFRIEPETQILLDGQQSGWEGIEPAPIDGERNPNIALEAGETYEIGWTEGDGIVHNIEIWDANDEVVDDYRTGVTEDPDEGQILEIEATEEMAYYVCNPHDGTMRGEIVVE